MFVYALVTFCPSLALLSQILFGIRSSEVMGAALTTLLTNADVLPRTEAKQIRIESPARHSDGSQFKGAQRPAAASHAPPIA